jgi:hypothetical protein
LCQSAEPSALLVKHLYPAHTRHPDKA